MTINRFADIPGFSRTAMLDEIRATAGNLSIPLYVREGGVGEAKGEYATDGLKKEMRAWKESSHELEQSINNLFVILGID